MKTILLTIFLFLNIQLIFGQDENSSKYRFANETFKSKKYKQNNYPKFEGKIEALENGAYQFEEKYLRISLEKREYENIFKLGIFNPDIVFGKETTKKTQAELDTLTNNQKVFYNLIRNDSLSICCVEEMEKLNPNPQTKRFIFWVFRIGAANPTEYYFELYNKNATKETSIEEFIENSRMTFYYKGTLII
jgi:hypothetical protein